MILSDTLPSTAKKIILTPEQSWKGAFKQLSKKLSGKDLAWFILKFMWKLSIVLALRQMLIYKTLCAIWCHLENLKNVNYNLGEAILLAKLQASACNFTKSNTSPWMFFMFLNCTNGAKSRKALHLQNRSYIVLIKSASCNTIIRSKERRKSKQKNKKRDRFIFK